MRALLEYADVIWDSCTQCEKNELEKKIQIEAARITTGAFKLVSINNVYKKKKKKNVVIHFKRDTTTTS